MISQKATKYTCELLKEITMQVLKERIAWLESTNEELCRELNEFRSRGGSIEQFTDNVKVTVCNRAHKS